MLNTIGTKRLETERLSLRKFRESDFKNVYENFTRDEDVGKYLINYPHKNIKQTKDYIKSLVFQYQFNMTFSWAITIKGNDAPIGLIDLHYVNDFFESCEICYMLSKAHWNKGIATEACKEVIKYGFEKVNFNRIAAVCQVENKDSAHIMEKLGMKYEGLIRGAAKNNKGEFCDMLQYAILKSDYLS